MKRDPVPPAMRRFLRTKEAARLAGVCRSQIYRLEQAGQFPQRRQIGPRSVAYLESEVMAWIESRPAKAPSVPKEAA